MLTHLLKTSGFYVIPESSATVIFKSVCDNKPDVILLDLWMPLMTGDEVARQLRADAQTQDCPIILFSASREGYEIARDLGLQAYLSKPFDIYSMTDTIKKVIANPRDSIL